MGSRGIYASHIQVIIGGMLRGLHFVAKRFRAHITGQNAVSIPSLRDLTDVPRATKEVLVLVFLLRHMYDLLDMIDCRYYRHMLWKSAPKTSLTFMGQQVRRNILEMDLLLVDILVQCGTGWWFVLVSNTAFGIQVYKQKSTL